MQKKIKTRLTLVHERINEAAKKIEETATQQTVEGRDDKAKALESSLKSLKKSLSRIRLCEDGIVVTLH
ncbi:hypothetical protein GHO25_03845 [Pseudomonas sp. FSL R10-1350]|uniref:hypothetical protein n=1 Tax=Pseudomonas sp. FSL R10-1350 TaxID=2662197 RepID=UPI001296F24C|nr:hypothetical protein [Pseudomonas sp. FSL R10-1350]MQU62264.1 hypothetical protein [Pseudomonas sp. FSL R10-1350]